MKNEIGLIRQAEAYPLNSNEILNVVPWPELVV
jgi:hypothetical protein